MKLIIASNNPGKIRECKEILEPLGFDVVSQQEAGVMLEPKENGATFADNAAIKARAIYEAVHGAVLADDSGLCVDALGGEPGVYSARYGGLKTSEERSQLILSKLGDTPQSERSAHFVCNIHLILEDGREITAEGRCSGYIGFEPKGENGFGYDPIFMHGDKSFAEISADEKNRLSHRAAALNALVLKLKEIDI